MKKRLMSLALCGLFLLAGCQSQAVQEEIWELEQDPAIDAILWLGGAGSTGYGSLARVLSGQVNHLVAPN